MAPGELRAASGGMLSSEIVYVGIGLPPAGDDGRAPPACQALWCAPEARLLGCGSLRDGSPTALRSRCVWRPGA